MGVKSVSSPRANSENQVAPPVWDARNSRIYAYLAQLVEQETLNFEVGGSNPSMGTRVAPHGEVNTQLL